MLPCYVGLYILSNRKKIKAASVDEKLPLVKTSTMEDISVLVVPLLLLLSLGVNKCVGSAKLPEGIELCKRNDDTCLLRSLKTAIPIFKEGLPDIDLPPFEPLRIVNVSIAQGTGPVNINLDLKDQDLAGVSTLNLTDAKGKFTDDSFNIELRAVMPLITLMGDYKVRGRILILPVQGAGKNTFHFEQVQASMILTGSIFKKEGEDYVHVDKLAVKMKNMKRMRANLTNLFNGDKALSDNMNKVINENWRLIWNELQPSVEKILGNLLVEIANNVYSHVPYKLVHLL